MKQIVLGGEPINSFKNNIDHLKVPDELYERMQKIGFLEFINDILFSAETPIYFRVDIVRVMAQLYLGYKHRIPKILTIDIDIMPDNNKLIDYMFNKPNSGTSATPKFIKSIFKKGGLVMFNGENGMTLINFDMINDILFFVEMCFLSLIIHPMLTYYGFLKLPNYFKYKGNIRNVDSYSRLVCYTFSQIVYGNYKALSYYYMHLLSRATSQVFRYASNSYNWISYNDGGLPYTMDLIEYFEDDSTPKNTDPIKRVKIEPRYLDMPLSQFKDWNRHPCLRE